MDYRQNVREKAEILAKVRLPNTWHLLPEYIRQQEIEWAIPQVEKALEWAAETAHAVNGPQLGKDIINSMLQVLGVIPENIS